MGMITAHARTKLGLSRADVRDNAEEVIVYDLSRAYNMYAMTVTHYAMDMDSETVYRTFQVMTELLLVSKDRIGAYSDAKLDDLLADRVLEELSYSMHTRYLNKKLDQYDIEDLLDIMNQVDILDILHSVMLDKREHAILGWFRVKNTVELHIARLSSELARERTGPIIKSSDGRIILRNAGSDSVHTFDPTHEP